MPQIRTTVLTVVLLLLFAANLFAAPLRTLTGISVDSSDKMVGIHLEMENNNGRSLGKVYYSGSMIRIVVENTALGKKTIRSLKSKDSALSSISIEKQGDDLSLKLQLTKRISSIMEHIVFEPGLNGSTIIIRKPAYFTKEAVKQHKVAIETKKEEIAEKIEEPIKEEIPPEKPEAVEKPPLPVELLEQPMPKPKPVASITKEDLAPDTKDIEIPQAETKADTAAAPETNLDENSIEQRKKRMEELFGKSEEENTEAAKENGFLGLGVNNPDMENLYIMAGVILALALLWFLFAKGKKFSFSGLSGPLNVIRSQNLGGKHKIILVEAEGKRLLLASTDKDVRLLTEIDAGRSADEQIQEAANTTNVRYLFSGDASETSGPPDIMPKPKTRSASNRPSYFGGKSQSGPAFQKKTSTAYRGADYSVDGPAGDFPTKDKKEASEPPKEESLKDKLRNLRRGG